MAIPENGLYSHKNRQNLCSKMAAALNEMLASAAVQAGSVVAGFNCKNLYQEGWLASDAIHPLPLTIPC